LRTATAAVPLAAGEITAALSAVVMKYRLAFDFDFARLITYPLVGFKRFLSYSFTFDRLSSK
jgi:hypothetical protein